MRTGDYSDCNHGNGDEDGEVGDDDGNDGEGDDSYGNGGNDGNSNYGDGDASDGDGEVGDGDGNDGEGDDGDGGDGDTSDDDFKLPQSPACWSPPYTDSTSERTACIRSCINQACYADVYGDDPLEEVRLRLI